MSAALLVAVFVFFLLMGQPVAFALGISSLIYIVFFSGFPPDILAFRILSGAQSFTLLALPLFILTANLMNESGMTDRLFRFCNSLIGHFRGGLALVNVLASLVFAGMSGSALADAAGLGKVEIKAMTDSGYDGEFAAAVTAASSTIGPVFPPSIPAVVYAMLTETSVGRLLLAGVLPGILITICLMVTVVMVGFRKVLPKEGSFSWRTVGNTFWQALPPLLTPIILVGGFIGGVFTPTEASAVAAVYAFIMGMVYRKFTWEKLKKVLVQTTIETGNISLVFMAAATFAWLLTMQQVPQMFTNWMLSIASAEWLILLFMLIFMWILGCFLDPMPGLMITIPVFLPLLAQMQVNLVGFGIVAIVGLYTGLLTPPFGLAVFITAGIAGVPTIRVFKAVLPFVISLMALVLLLAYVPQISLLLPNLLMGK